MPDIITKILLVFAMLAVVGLAGAFLYILISYERKKRNEFIKNSIETEGIVENKNLNIIHPSFYRLEYSYLDNNRKKYNGLELMGVLVFRYKKGEKITVYYDPKNPNRSIVKQKRN